jgi:hypothetical protein
VHQKGSKVDQEGTTVEFVATVQEDQASMLSQTKVTALEEILVVQEYLDVFPQELSGMPQIAT